MLLQGVRELVLEPDSINWCIEFLLDPHLSIVIRTFGLQRPYARSPREVQRLNLHVTQLGFSSEIISVVLSVLTSF